MFETEIPHFGALEDITWCRVVAGYCSVRTMYQCHL